MQAPGFGDFSHESDGGGDDDAGRVEDFPGPASGLADYSLYGDVAAEAVGEVGSVALI